MAALWKKLLAALAALALTASPALAAGPRPDKEHLPVSYAEMTLEPFDDTALRAAIGALEELSAIGRLNTDIPDKHVTVQALYDTILAEYDRMETQYYLWGIASDADVYDYDLAGGYLDWAEGLAEAGDACWAAMGLLSGTAYEDILAADIGDYSAAHLGEWASQSAGDNSLALREEALIREYQTAIAQGDTDAVGAVFLNLAALRQEMAAAYGYDSYTAYAYDYLYDRDYSPEDAQWLCQMAKDCLVPLSDKILDLAGRDMDALDRLSMDGVAMDQLLVRLSPLMADMHPALGEAFTFMIDHHLYDLEDSDTKADTGYTVPLAQYGTAFIYNKPYNTWEDCSTIAHEFGHFVQAFYDPTPALWASQGTDLGELQSQGLELLITHYADDLFQTKKLADGFTWASVYNLVGAVVDGCMYDEFQQAVYGAPEPLTLDWVNETFLRIARDYGYTDEVDPADWMETPHCFTQPLYHISYAVSALSALDLWLTTRDNWSAAVDTYMALSATDLAIYYRDAIDDAGLRDIFSPWDLRAIANALESALKADYGRQRVMGGKKPALGTLTEGPAPVLLPLFAVILLAAITFRTARRKLRRDGGSGPSSPARDPWDEGFRAPGSAKKEDPWE